MNWEVWAVLSGAIFVALIIAFYYTFSCGHAAGFEEGWKFAQEQSR